jgi:hypothetical protein
LYNLTTKTNDPIKKQVPQKKERGEDIKIANTKTIGHSIVDHHGNANDEHSEILPLPY